MNKNEQRQITGAISVDEVESKNGGDQATKGKRKKVWQGKGNGTLYSDHSFEFRFPEEGSGWKKNVIKKRGDAMIYETTGEKQQSIVAHLKVEKGCEDPAAELFEQLTVLTKDMVKGEPEQPTSKTLAEQDGLKVWNLKKKGQLLALLTIDSTMPKERMTSKLFALAAEVNKVIDSTKF